MTDADIADTISAFGRAAGDAKRLGFDVVEVHGAHGHLLDQFFWSGTNRRAELFGGATLSERSRFAIYVVMSVRAAVGPDFPVLLRLSQWKQQDYSVRLAPSPDKMAEWLVPLVEAGADFLYCSQRRFWDAEFPEVDGDAGLNFAGWAKKLTGAAAISVGSVGLSGGLGGRLRTPPLWRSSTDSAGFWREISRPLINLEWRKNGGARKFAPRGNPRELYSDKTFNLMKGIPLPPALHPTHGKIRQYSMGKTLSPLYRKGSFT